MTKYIQMTKRFRAALCLLALAAVSCGGSPTDPSQNVNVPYSQTDLTVGTGRVAANGNRVTVNYTGWLYSPTAPDNKGQQFDSSIGRAPLPVTLGSGGVIKGFDQGIVGMAVGGKRRVTLPPSLAYGSQGSPPAIPPNATLVFEIDLLSVSD
jgi:FKBP-type peptidyl-prolyl cis-trans isomerase FkpA